MIHPRRPMSWLALAALLGLVILAGCKHHRQKAHPRPKAAKAEVAAGELVQLRLAVEGFDAIFDARAEEQDLLPALVHAWATFYHWRDPAPTLAARYDFTRRLCAARVPALAKPDLFTCMDRLRGTLYDDLVWATDAYIHAGHPDKIGPYRLRRLRKEFRLRRDQFRATQKLRQDRRTVRQLPSVATCAVEQPTVPVVGLHPKGLTLNGFPILSAPDGITDLKGAELDGFRLQLENRLQERTSIRRAAQQVVLATDRRVGSAAWIRLLTTIADLGVTRLCLKVMRRDAFPVPCCLVVRVTPRLVAIGRSVILGRRGAVFKDGPKRTPLPTDPKAWPAARKALGEPGATTLAVQLRPGVPTGRLIPWLVRLSAPDRPPEIVLNPAPRPRTPPHPADPPPWGP